MTRTLSILAGALLLAFAVSACDVAGTAVRKTGETAADTTRAAGNVGATAVEGTADTVESTTSKAGRRMERQ
jgi:hypothetical protein